MKIPGLKRLGIFLFQSHHNTHSMAAVIKKTINSTISTLEQIFKERFFTVRSTHKAIGGALAKCFHDSKGYQFTFTKMELASMDERNSFIDDFQTPITFEDNFQKISFKLDACVDFQMQIGFSGFTSVNGVITEFTTESLKKHSIGYYRAVIPTSRDFYNSQHFANTSRLNVGNTTYGSGVLEFKVNNIKLHSFIYSDDKSDKKYYFIENQDKCTYDEFINFLDETLLSITYLTGAFLGREIYIVASETEEHEITELIGLKYFFEDLRSGKNAVPDSHMFHNLRMPVTLVEAFHFGSLVDQLQKSLVLKRTVLLLCQAHTEPQYIRSSLYSVALETITGLITENIKEKINPVQDKSMIKSILADLKKTLSNYESAISPAAFKLFSGYVERINSPTNKQKLLVPFKHFGIMLPEKDADAIGKRNDFLHGRMPELGNQDELIILNNRILFCIDCLVLKYIGYKGFIMYHPALHQLHTKTKVEEYPIRKI